eukprot:TRINITY_DN2865_c0_g3_i2.p1 TRINITY_DN2865_c0_g3~~TRINITY_DN2865_c0_g3_i2.p1  ORF type:complete len:1355 (+),score=274.15 TRINITY_DN2865_c0_g3_i2:81-4145(+)
MKITGQTNRLQEPLEPLFKHQTSFTPVDVKLMSKYVDSSPSKQTFGFMRSPDPHAVVAIVFSSERDLIQGSASVCELLGRKLRDSSLFMDVKKLSIHQTILAISGCGNFYARFAKQHALLKQLKSGEYAPFDPDVSEDYLGSEDPATFFTSAEKHYMIYKKLIQLTADKKDINAIAGFTFVKGESILKRLVEQKVVKDILPLSEKTIALKIRNIKSSADRPTILHHIRSYLGDEFAVYFAWLDHYNQSLLIPAILGTVVFAYMLFVDMVSPVNIAFAVFVSFWSTIQLEQWKAHNQKIIFEWGMNAIVQEEPQRTSFVGHIVADVYTGKIAKKAYGSLQWARLISGYLAVLVLVAVCSTISFVVVNHQVAFKNNVVWGIAVYGAYSLWIYISTTAFRKINPFLMKFDNHEFESDYEKHAISKCILFELGNRFSGLLYTAFVLQDMDTLRFQLYLYFIVGQFSNALIENGLPYFRTNVLRESLESDSLPQGLEDSQLQTSERPSHEPQLITLDQKVRESLALEDYDGVFDEYMEMVLQFAFVTCFSGVMPLAPALALMNNVFEWDSDLNKLLFSHKRPLPSKACTIGIWTIVLEVVSIVAVPINAAIGFFTAEDLTSYFYAYSPLVVLAGVIFAEHLIVGLKISLYFLVPVFQKDMQEKLQSRREAIENALEECRIQFSESTEAQEAVEPNIPTQLPPLEIPNIVLLVAALTGYLCGALELHVLATPFIYYLFRSWESNEELRYIHKTAHETKPILCNIPKKFDSCESVEWMNHVTAVVWSKYRVSIEAYLQNYVNSWLECYKPNMLSTFEVAYVRLGAACPRVSNLRTMYRRSMKELALECDFTLSTNLELAITIGIGTKKLLITLDDLQLSFQRLNISLELLKSSPYLSSVTLFTESTPVVDFSINVPVLGNLMDWRIFRTWIRNTIGGTLRYFLVDNPCRIPLAEDSIESEYRLTVTLDYGKNFPVADLTGLCDPYCILELDGITSKSQVQSETLNPVWNQQFQFLTKYRVGAGAKSTLVMKFYDKDLTVDDYLGQIQIPLRDLKPNQPCHKIMDLMEAHTGIVSVQFLLSPVSDSDEHEGIVDVGIVGLYNYPTADLRDTVSYICSFGQEKVTSGPQNQKDGLHPPVHVSVPVVNLHSSSLAIQAVEGESNILGTASIDLSAIVAETENSIIAPFQSGIGSIQMVVNKMPWSKAPPIKPFRCRVQISHLQVKDFVMPQLIEDDLILSKSKNQFQRTTSWLKKSFKPGFHLRIGTKILVSRANNPKDETFDAAVEDKNSQNLFIYLIEQGATVEDALGEVIIPLRTLSMESIIEDQYPLKSEKYNYAGKVPHVSIRFGLVAESGQAQEHGYH